MTRPLAGFLLGFSCLMLLGATATMSSCSFGDDNVGDVYAPATSAPQSTPQIPESMKTGSVTGWDPQGPPQGL